MATIRANRESIDDRFSVLGFTVRSETPLFEVGLATDPDLLKAENSGRRTPRNFYTSRVLRATPSQRGEAIYLVPPDVVARFVGQPRLYFGLATYRENDPAAPISLRIPDRGTMYVSLAGLTERGLRRTARTREGGSAYGNGGNLSWGGDTASATAPASRGGTTPAAEPAPYSDGYSDELWNQQPSAQPPATAATAPAPVPTPTSATTPAPSATTAPASASPAVTPVTPVTPATSAPATTQGLAARRNRRPVASSRSLLISSDYHPSDFWDALRAQLGFFVDSTMWYLGVDNTRVMPHSAICQIRVPDGSAEGGLHGSGFFIGPRLIMTAAHVVHGQSELIVVPGKSGGGIGTATEPFGRFRVTQFRKHPSYTGNSDFDVALICVPASNAVAAGNYFDLVEELTQSRPEGVVVSGYAARWYADDLIEHFVNATIDPNRQHMMGGYIRELPTDETFSYNIQTLGGTSGSPVYWIENGAAGPQAHLVGVHVAAHDETTNLGCRITANKLVWIRQIAAEWGQTLTFSLGVHALAEAGDEDDARGIEGPIPDSPDAPQAPSTSQGLSSRILSAPSPEYPMASRFEPANTGNYRAGSGTRAIDKIVIHITDGGANINGPISWFKNPAARVSAHYVIGQDGEVVQMVRHDDIAWHAGSANRSSIGIEHVANTRGLMPTPAQLCASAALVTWLCDQFGIPIDRDHVLGHAEADPGTSHRACPNAVWDWDYYMDMVNSRTCHEPGTNTTQSLGVHALGSNGPADYAVDLVPQPDKNACWAASMAMLLSYRRQVCVSPETVVNEVGGSLASSYSWDLLQAVRSRYGFEEITQPSNASIYHTPRQWAEWLNTYGPLWVVIVGAPHAVVVAGIRGNLDDPGASQVKILNPWDTRVAFDNDPIAFHPENRGYEDWLPFSDFAADFGNMAEPDYGNWRILYLPVNAVTAQSLSLAGLRLAAPPAPVRVLSTGGEGERREPIEPSRVAGTSMVRTWGEAGACRWALDQLAGMKTPANSATPPAVGSTSAGETRVELNDWPAVEGAPTPLPITLTFRANNGSVGDIAIVAGMPANLAYGVDVTATINDRADAATGIAAIAVRVDYRFHGLAEGNPEAFIQLCLRGDGQFERENGWQQPQAELRAA